MFHPGGSLPQENQLRCDVDAFIDLIAFDRGEPARQVMLENTQRTKDTNSLVLDYPHQQDLLQFYPDLISITRSVPPSVSTVTCAMPRVSPEEDASFNDDSFGSEPRLFFSKRLFLFRAITLLLLVSGIAFVIPFMLTKDAKNQKSISIEPPSPKSPMALPVQTPPPTRSNASVVKDETASPSSRDPPTSGPTLSDDYFTVPPRDETPNITPTVAPVGAEATPDPTSRAAPTASTTTPIPTASTTTPIPTATATPPTLAPTVQETGGLVITTFPPRDGKNATFPPNDASDAPTVPTTSTFPTTNDGSDAPTAAPSVLVVPAVPTPVEAKQRYSVSHAVTWGMVSTCNESSSVFADTAAEAGLILSCNDGRGNLTIRDTNNTDCKPRNIARDKRMRVSCKMKGTDNGDVQRAVAHVIFTCTSDNATNLVATAELPSRNITSCNTTGATPSRKPLLRRSLMQGSPSSAAAASSTTTTTRALAAGVGGAASFVSMGRFCRKDKSEPWIFSNDLYPCALGQRKDINSTSSFFGLVQETPSYCYTIGNPCQTGSECSNSTNSTCNDQSCSIQVPTVRMSDMDTRSSCFNHTVDDGPTLQEMRNATADAFETSMFIDFLAGQLQ